MCARKKRDRSRGRGGRCVGRFGSGGEGGGSKVSTRDERGTCRANRRLVAARGVCIGASRSGGASTPIAGWRGGGASWRASGPVGVCGGGGEGGKGSGGRGGGAGRGGGGWRDIVINDSDVGVKRKGGVIVTKFSRCEAVTPDQSRGGEGYVGVASDSAVSEPGLRPLRACCVLVVDRWAKADFTLSLAAEDARTGAGTGLGKA